MGGEENFYDNVFTSWPSVKGVWLTHPPLEHGIHSSHNWTTKGNEMPGTTSRNQLKLSKKCSFTPPHLLSWSSLLAFVLGLWSLLWLKRTDRLVPYCQGYNIFSELEISICENMEKFEQCIPQIKSKGNYFNFYYDCYFSNKWYIW